MTTGRINQVSNFSKPIYLCRDINFDIITEFVIKNYRFPRTEKRRILFSQHRRNFANKPLSTATQI